MDCFGFVEVRLAFIVFLVSKLSSVINSNKKNCSALAMHILVLVGTPKKSFKPLETPSITINISLLVYIIFNIVQ
ncbi:hypothetical protein D7Z94_05870 [Ulvibacterium marinum]|uniref:Uncharacterized protein n=1 Tax=Ulvibacterium marinum TaxID=2419782 RepID=A0A3B0CDJ4_9FLAO|nr:hypothetical protein D7Z94_05870 [Ulvibacterium marinum]